MVNLGNIGSCLHLALTLFIFTLPRFCVYLNSPSFLVFLFLFSYFFTFLSLFSLSCALSIDLPQTYCVLISWGVFFNYHWSSIPVYPTLSPWRHQLQQ